MTVNVSARWYLQATKISVVQFFLPFMDETELIFFFLFSFDNPSEYNVDANFSIIDLNAQYVQRPSCIGSYVLPHNKMLTIKRPKIVEINRLNIKLHRDLSDKLLSFFILINCLDG